MEDAVGRATQAGEALGKAYVTCSTLALGMARTVGGRMHVGGIATLVCLVATAIGCAEGTGGGHVAVRGSLQTVTGQPIPDREIQFVLPAAYGLGGLDLVDNTPEDFGQHDQPFTAKTDANGEFSHDLGSRIYHVDCWSLLGCFPTAAPPPFVLVRVVGYPSEYYAVQTGDGEFKVYRTGGREIPLSEAALARLDARSESSSVDGERSTVGVIDLRFRNP